MEQRTTYQILVDPKNVIVGSAISTGTVGGAPDTHRWITVSAEVFSSVNVQDDPIGKYMYNESDGTIYENPDFAEANAAGKIYDWETMEWIYPNWGGVE